MLDSYIIVKFLSSTSQVSTSCVFGCRYKLKYLQTLRWE